MRSLGTSLARRAFAKAQRTKHIYAHLRSPNTRALLAMFDKQRRLRCYVWLLLLLLLLRCLCLASGHTPWWPKLVFALDWSWSSERAPCRLSIAIKRSTKAQVSSISAASSASAWVVQVSASECKWMQVSVSEWVSRLIKKLVVNSRSLSSVAYKESASAQIIQLSLNLPPSLHQS